MSNTLGKQRLFSGVFERGLSTLNKNKTEIAFVLAILSCGIVIDNAYAEIPEMSVFAHSAEVSDAVLAETRGKFVSAGQITNFGVQMVTEWVTASGERINASAMLSVNMAGSQPKASFKPSITIQQVQPAGSVSAQNGNFVSGSKGLEQVTGVVQSIQVAGKSNGIANGIGISIKRSHGANTYNPDGDGYTNNMHLMTPAGNSADISLANNGLSVGVKVADQGHAMQSIKSVAMGNGQVMQSVQLGGDLNQVNNLINLEIQTRSILNSPSMNASDVLASLRQLSNTTPF